MNKLKVSNNKDMIYSQFVDCVYGFKQLGYTSTIEIEKDSIELFGYNDEYIRVFIDKNEDSLYVKSDKIDTDRFIKEFNEVIEKYVNKSIVL